MGPAATPGPLPPPVRGAAAPAEVAGALAAFPAEAGAVADAPLAVRGPATADPLAGVPAVLAAGDPADAAASPEAGALPGPAASVAVTAPPKGPVSPAGAAALWPSAARIAVWSTRVPHPVVSRTAVSAPRAARRVMVFTKSLRMVP
jgi:hypothetical protein